MLWCTIFHSRKYLVSGTRNTREHGPNEFSQGKAYMLPKRLCSLTKVTEDFTQVRPEADV